MNRLQQVNLPQDEYPLKLGKSALLVWLGLELEAFTELPLALTLALGCAEDI